MSYTLPEDGKRRQSLPIFPPSDRSMSIHGPGSLLDKKQFNILEKLKQLRDNKIYCDVILEVRGVKLEAHKNVLAAWSPYFASKLFPEKTEVFKDTILVNYDNSEVFSDLLDFMYNGYVAPRETNFLQLLHLAVSFQIEMLKNYCEEFLRCNLHLGNFVSTYFLSRKYKLDSLEEYIVGFLQLNLSDAVKQGEFLSLTARKFNTLLSRGWMEQIKPEIKLFLIISWVGYDVQEREKFLVLLLGHIDWSSVAKDFLLEISRTENFFTSHESSLYLLLQTLYSAGIPIGPYTETFPSLRETHEHILNEVVDTSLLQIEIDEFFQATISVVSRPGRRDKCINTLQYRKDERVKHKEVREACINTDVNSEHFEKTENDTTISVMEPSDEAILETEEEIGNLTISSKSHELDEVGKYIESELDQLNRKILDRNPTEPVQEVADENATPKSAERVKKERVTRSAVKKAVKTKVTKKILAKKPVNHKVSLKEKKIQETADDLTRVKVVDTEQNLRKNNLKRNVLNLNQTDHSHPPSLKEDVNAESDSDLNDETSEKNIRVAESEVSSSDPGVTDFGKPFRKYRKREKDEITNKPIKVDNLICVEPDCSYTTKIKGRLEKHIERVHKTVVDLKCNLCTFSSNCVRTFNGHMKEHIPGPPYKCDEPGCTYSHEKMSVLLVHRGCHSNERPYSCSQCAMRFKSNNNLLQHKKTHLGVKNHPCPVCKICFATKNTLMQHLVTHDETRPYLCDECGFSTKFQSHLSAHKRIHTGDVFYCQFPNCDYSTPKRSQLKSHMKFHLRIRSYTCQTCGKSFIERSHLIRHEKIHKDDKLKCEDCDYTSTRKDKLKDHIARHHSVEAKLKKEKKEAAKLKAAAQRQSHKAGTTPVLVKWDHGGYSIPPNEDPEDVFQDGNSEMLVEDNYCVLRNQLTTNEALSQPLMQTVLPDHHMSGQTQLADISSCQPDMDHTGALHQDDAFHQDGTLHQDGPIHDEGPSMAMVNSPGHIDHVNTSGVSTGLDVNNIHVHESHNYTSLSTVTSVPSQHTTEYGGLGAFMALF